MRHYYDDVWLSWYYDSPEGFGFRNQMRDSHCGFVPKERTNNRIQKKNGGVR